MLKVLWILSNAQTNDIFSYTNTEAVEDIYVYKVKESTVKFPSKVAFISSGFEWYPKDNFKWRKFNTEVSNLG
jgi:hypothetical protein